MRARKCDLTLALACWGSPRRGLALIAFKRQSERAAQQSAFSSLDAQGI